MRDASSDQRRDFFVHESSYVDEPSSIGEGTKIWHFSHVMPGCEIGSGCNIGQNVVIGPRVRIGNRVKIQNNVSVYEGVELEDEVFCGPSMVFTNVFTPRSGTPRNTAADYLKTLVKKGASIGANATIVCGNTIGEYAFVGAGARRHERRAALCDRVRQSGARSRIRLRVRRETSVFEQRRATCAECGRAYTRKDAVVRKVQA